MLVIKTVAELQSWSDAVRAEGCRVALVPTMGALHAGHLSLVETAKTRADRVVVSIFVNPAQFGEGEDLSAYPRTLEADLEACRSRGVDTVFLPSVADLYPSGYQTWVGVSELSRALCGASRPGHFRGVATVVAKLFLAAKPHVAVFGEKDFQQLAVIRRLERDLGFGIEIAGAPIAREADGLALSSRNANLTAESRRQALALVRALDVAERAVEEGTWKSREIIQRVRRELAHAPLACVDYAELRDPDNLEPAPAELGGPTLLALAVRFPARTPGETVRLIDNRVLDPNPHREAN